MKDRLFQRFRRLFLFVCCAALTLLNGHARAQEEKLIETSAKAAVLIEKTPGGFSTAATKKPPCPWPPPPRS